jgi:hypothetical protein
VVVVAAVVVVVGAAVVVVVGASVVVVVGAAVVVVGRAVVDVVDDEVVEEEVVELDVVVVSFGLESSPLSCSRRIATTMAIKMATTTMAQMSGLRPGDPSWSAAPSGG